MVFDRLSRYGGLVMISHTIFSLPFGVVAMIWAADGLPKWTTVLWILVALFGARNGANAFNRVADRSIDKKNPRTASRHVPLGSVSVFEAVCVTVFCFALMAVAAYMLNVLCLILLPLAVFIFVFYSYSKRFTWLCHLILGMACGGAPVGAWIAVTGGIDVVPIVLGATVTMWIAGFDVVYALQDIEFDRKEGLYSIPARFGEKGARLIAIALHIGAFILLLANLFLMKLGLIYLAGVMLIGLLLVMEHRSVVVGDEKKMKIASYSINQVVGIVYLVFTLADYFVAGV